jgi:hypothetical protein
VLSEWDFAFIMPLLVGNCKGLFDLMLAANYLDIKPLFDMCCATMAAIMKTKPPEQVAGMLGVDINLSNRYVDLNSNRFLCMSVFHFACLLICLFGLLGLSGVGAQ